METSTQIPALSSVPETEGVTQACTELLEQFDVRAEALLKLLSDRLDK